MACGGRRLGEEGRWLGEGRAAAWVGDEGRRLGEDVRPPGAAGRLGAGQTGGGALGRPGGSRASTGEENTSVLSFFSFSFFFVVDLCWLQA